MSHRGPSIAAEVALPGMMSSSSAIRKLWHVSACRIARCPDITRIFGPATLGLYYGHFAMSFRMVYVPRIVNGTRSTFARGTVAKSDVPGFLRRDQ